MSGSPLSDGQSTTLSGNRCHFCRNFGEVKVSPTVPWACSTPSGVWDVRFEPRFH